MKSIGSDKKPQFDQAGVSIDSARGVAPFPVAPVLRAG